MEALASLEVGFDVVRLRSPDGGEPVLVERAPYQPKARPILKWAGGKQWLVPLADALLPETFNGRYYEPFFGGGAVYFALRPARATLSDANRELVVMYEAVRSDAEAVIDVLRQFPNTKEFFEKLRDESPTDLSTRAARLIFLNKTAFNGLYRVSRTGRFNVPYGRYAHPTICNEPRLRHASAALKGVSLSSQPFTRILGHARAGDFAYLDPPYITTHTNNGFLKYNAHLFSWRDQLKLADQVRALDSRGVRVVVSNADHSDVRSLYGGLYGFSVGRRSAIGGGMDYRGRVRELLVTNFPLFGVETPVLP
jgi:DNA adenine methylase